MIDPHVHFRNGGKQSYEDTNETIEHGIKVAHEVGLDAVFDMPNPDPPITTRSSALTRSCKGREAVDRLGIEIFYGIYGGLAHSGDDLSDDYQIREMVWTYNEMFPSMVGLKMFAGHSTGNLGIIPEEAQKNVYRILGEERYKGVLAVHCEKESELVKDEWNPNLPFSHTLARPPSAEFQSIKDQIDFAVHGGFIGTLHICHISTPESLEYVEKMRDLVEFRITTGVTPHHCMLYDVMMAMDGGKVLKMNPPLRKRISQQAMYQALLDGRIDWIETDHAPHSLKKKIQEPYASGIPVLPYYPHFIDKLIKDGMSLERLADVTHNNIVHAFGLDKEVTFRVQDTKRYALPFVDQAREYDFDPFARVK